MLERMIEKVILASRWLLVPLYLGLAAMLLVLTWQFYADFFHVIATLGAADDSAIILETLALIDLVLVAGLITMVVISSYENFVSKIDVGDNADTPPLFGKLDPGTLKIKLGASIVAISSIQLLKAFVSVGKYTSEELAWLIGIHMTLVVSTLLMAIIDKITFGKSRKPAA
ncbi:MAG: TIGR00645 family protein [Zavarzinia sp.]|nr:TIGR00645 family protein [Zavarzinia sp.]